MQTPSLKAALAPTHRAMDTLMAAFLWLHVPVITAIASQRRAEWVHLALLAGAIAAAATWLRASAHGSASTRLTMAIALVGMVTMLLGATAGSAFQADIHTYSFVAVALLAAYCDAGVILAAASAMAIDLLVLNITMPGLVFSGASGTIRVPFHIGLLAMEGAALAWTAVRVAEAVSVSAEARAHAQAARAELAAKTARAEVLLRNNQRLRVLSDTDGLTGIGNRRFFDGKLASLWRESSWDAQPVGLLLMDIDHFKHFNDAYGHQAGDRCLLLVADLLREMTRVSQDIAARFGGEEFAVLLPRAPLGRVQSIAERLRCGVEGIVVPPEGTCRISISIGCASMTPSDGDMAAALIAAADAALYCAKNGGRNRVHPPVAIEEAEVI